LDLDYSVISTNAINFSDDIFINNINYSNDNDIIFCGFDKLGNKGLVGILNNSGRIKWMKNFDNWDEFSKIVIKENGFFVTGKSKLAAGFIEISNDGKKYNEYAFKLYNDLKNTVDLDIYNDTTLVLTNYKEGVDLNTYSYLILNKVKYTPLFVENTPDDTTKTDTTKTDTTLIKVKFINPNPAHSEINIQFFKELVPVEIQIYNSEGLLVDSKFLSKEKTTEITHNIQKLSIGIYFVKVITETEILEGKFIKY
jgi:hypothetical protein